MTYKPVLRRCVACRKVIDRNQLFKVTKDHKDGVVLEGGMGRSAYICPNETCLEEAWRRKRIEKALRCKVNCNVIESLQDRLNRGNDSISEAR
ncbi:YlxR family protein [Prochlorococcus sp. MIT 1223]|uniref:YlxR family protein n=1 Tax=Prochlorococcus sp. MIT 1223 TaxID=3096217 RepID=UPI002A75F565|nr:YlxR family protein [Prochlorococcus sp. MIT 1223]